MTPYDNKFFQLWEANKSKYSQYPDYPSGAKIFNLMHEINPATRGYELVALSANTNGIINTIATLQWENIPLAARTQMRADLQTIANQAINSNYVAPDNGSDKSDCPKCEPTVISEKIFGLDAKVVAGATLIIGGVIGYFAGKK